METPGVLERENFLVSGKMNQERFPGRNALGSVPRKRFSDITNLRQQNLSPIQDEKLKQVSCSTKDYIEQLQKENMTLLKLLVERNKMIELTGAALTKMRINLQKVQQQNWHLAQANSLMLAELNLGKDRLKTMQHELGCKTAIIEAKNIELQEKVKKKPCHKPCTEELNLGKDRLKTMQHELGCKTAIIEAKNIELQEKVKKKPCHKPCTEVTEEATHDSIDNKESKPNRRRQSRVHSLGISVAEQAAVTEKADERRKSARRKSEQHQPINERASSVPCKIKSQQRECTDEKAENKRLCVRRQSARFKPEIVESTEDLFEIEEAKFPISPLLHEKMQDWTTSSMTETVEKNDNLRSETPAVRRSLIGRPMRKSAEKVISYKEPPLKKKLRREH